VRLLDLVDDGRGLHRLRLLPRRVPPGRAIRREGVGVGALEVPHEDGLGHQRRNSRMRSTLSGVRLISYRSSSCIIGAASDAHWHLTACIVTWASTVVSLSFMHNRSMR